MCPLAPWFGFRGSRKAHLMKIALWASCCRALVFAIVGATWVLFEPFPSLSDWYILCAGLTLASSMLLEKVSN